MANQNGGQTVPRITRAEHIGPLDTGDNIEAKRVAGYVWNPDTLAWERMTQPDISVGSITIEGVAAYADSSDIPKAGLVDADRHVQVDVLTMPPITVDPPVGGATEAEQEAQTALLTTIEANQLPDGHNVTVDNASLAITAAALPLPTGASTSSKQDDLITAVSSLGKEKGTATGASDIGIATYVRMETDSKQTTVDDGDYAIPSMTSWMELRTRDQRAKDIQNCNTVGDFTILGNDTANLASSTNHVFGTSAITFDKVNGAADTVYAGVSFTIGSLNISEIFEDGGFVSLAAFLPSLSNVEAVGLRLGTDSANYNYWEWASSDLVSGTWMQLRSPTSQPNGYAGNGWNTNDVDWGAVYVRFNSQSNTLAGIVIDNIHFVQGRITDTSLDASISSSISTPNVNVARVGGSQIDTNVGNVSAGTQRIVLATDQPTIPVSAASLPLPSGAATAANQGTIIGHLDAVETTLSAINAAQLPDGHNVTIDNPGDIGGGIQYTEGDTDTTFTGTMSLVEGAANAAATLKQPTTPSDTQPISASSLPLPSGASTSANQSTIIGHLDGVEALLGTIDADTSTLAATDFATEAKQDDIITAIGAIPGGGGTQYTDGDADATPTGTVAMGFDGTNVQALATDSSGNLQAEVINTVTVDGSGVTQPVSAASLPLPTGAATAANQQTDALTDTELRAAPVVVDLGTDNDVTVTGNVAVTNAGLTELAAAINGSSQVDVNIAAGNITGFATSANQSTIIGHLDGVETTLTSIDTSLNDIEAAVEIIDNAISGNEMQVDVITMPTTTVQATNLDIRDLTATDVVTANLSATDNAVLDSIDEAVSSKQITTIGHGVTTVTTAGTDVALAASTACKRITIQAQTDNTGVIAVGGSGVDATVATGTGILLFPGDAYELDIDNLADVFIDSSVNGEGVRYTWFN